MSYTLANKRTVSGSRSTKARAVAAETRYYKMTMYLLSAGILIFGLVQVHLGRKVIDYGKEIRVCMEDNARLQNLVVELESKKETLSSEKRIKSIASNMGMAYYGRQREILPVKVSSDYIPTSMLPETVPGRQ